MRGRFVVPVPLRWVFVALWMGLIFWFSAQPDSGQQSGWVMMALLSFVPVEATPEVVDAAHHLLRKAAHFTEYAILAGLTWWALPPSGFKRAAVAWAIATVYAASDEYHQGFVANRGPSVWDVGIDSLGALTAVVVLWSLSRWHRA